ncbi:MAG: hypothetical protein ABIP94_03070 [Planctomycetota bacterium]
MHSSLPVRRLNLNTGPAVAAPSAFHVLATRPLGADRCEVLLRGEIEATPAQARKHALLVLDALAPRHPVVDVQVIGADNLPLFVLSQGGVS